MSSAFIRAGLPQWRRVAVNNVAGALVLECPNAGKGRIDSSVPDSGARLMLPTIVKTTRVHRIAAAGGAGDAVVVDFYDAAVAADAVAANYRYSLRLRGQYIEDVTAPGEEHEFFEGVWAIVRSDAGAAAAVNTMVQLTHYTARTVEDEGDGEVPSFIDLMPPAGLGQGVGTVLVPAATAAGASVNLGENPNLGKGIEDPNDTDGLPKLRAPTYITGFRAWREDGGAAMYVDLYDSDAADVSALTPFATLAWGAAGQAQNQPGELIGPFHRGIRVVPGVAADCFVSGTRKSMA